MFAIPIAAREARETCRRPRAYHSRWIVGLIALCSIPFALYIAQYSNPKGMAVFGTLGVIAHLYTLFAGVIVASDAISSERREETLGLLFLTDLKPRHVLLGKWIASSTIAFFGLLAFIPFLAIPQMMGGVTTEHFVLLTIHLLNTLFLSVAWGLVASTIFLRGWAALCAGVSVMFMVSLGYILFRVWFHDGSWEAFDFVCPTTGLGVLLSDTITGRSAYWQSLAFNHACAWLLLGIVAVRMVYIWRDEPATVRQQRLRERFRIWRFGNRRARQRLRKKLLDASPLAWLANRDYVSSLGLLAFCFLSFAGVILLWMLAPDGRSDEVMFISVLALLLTHVLLFFRICISSAYYLSEDRKSGALELLLSTPLSVTEIIRGRWLGLARQFFGPALIIGITHAIVLGAVFSETDRGDLQNFWPRLRVLNLTGSQMFLCFNVICFVVPILNWVAAGWLGMWLGLRFKSSASAVWIAVVLVLLAPWVAHLLGLFTVFMVLKPFDIDDDKIITVSWLSAFVLGLVNAGGLMHFGRARLAKYFRSAAADRFHIYKIPFPWRALVKFAAMSTVVLAAGLASFWLWFEHTNRTGAAQWAAAQKAFPQLAAASPELPALEPIPTERNLAYAPVLESLNQSSRIRRRRHDPIQNLQNPFSSNFPAPTNRWVETPNHVSPWRQGGLVDLDRYVDYAHQRLLFTNASGPGPRFVLDALAFFDPTFQELLTAAETRPLTRFAINHPAVGELASLLSLRATARLRDGQVPFEDVRLILRLAQGVDHFYPNYHGALQSSFQPVFEGLYQQRWHDAQLAEFQRLYAGFDLWPRWPANFLKQTGQNLKELDDRIKSKKEADFFLHSFLAGFYPQGVIDHAKARVVTAAGRDLPLALDLVGKRINASQADALFFDKSGDDADFRTSVYVHLHEFSKKQTRLMQIQIACALERYRLKNDRLPSALTELVPDYIPTLPLDMFTGEPLLYRQTDDGRDFVLYSRGWDGLDHQPAMRPTGNEETDELGWPWRSRGELVLKRK